MTAEGLPVVWHRAGCRCRLLLVTLEPDGRWRVVEPDYRAELPTPDRWGDVHQHPRVRARAGDRVHLLAADPADWPSDPWLSVGCRHTGYATRTIEWARLLAQDVNLYRKTRRQARRDVTT